MFEEHQDKVDPMLIDGQLAEDRSTQLIVDKKKKKPGVKIVVVANNPSTKTRVLDHGAHEFTPNPISAQMRTNKMLTLLATNRITA